MLGSVDGDAGRRVVAAADVCLIPFVEGPVADAINSVKMFTYLSLGKPVVATDTEECRANPFVATAAGPAAIAAEIVRASKSDSPETAGARRAFAAANTWETRAVVAADVIATAVGVRAQQLRRQRRRRDARARASRS
jgi:hypothetical protein